jgi:NAD dependent epimerase/dehydratase family
MTNFDRLSFSKNRSGRRRQSRHRRRAISDVSGLSVQSSAAQIGQPHNRRLPDRAASFSAPVVSSCRLKVVVTGASGKAGRAVVRDLIDHDYEVHAVDVVPPGESQATFLLADVTDFEQTVECLPGVDAVVHLAAILPPESTPWKPRSGRTCSANRLPPFTGRTGTPKGPRGHLW